MQGWKAKIILQCRRRTCRPAFGTVDNDIISLCLSNNCQLVLDIVGGCYFDAHRNIELSLHLVDHGDNILGRVLARHTALDYSILAFFQMPCLPQMFSNSTSFYGLIDSSAPGSLSQLNLNSV